MAIVSKKISDLSGNEGTDDEFAAVVIRQYPGLDQPKALDVLVPELGQFKDVSDDLVILEVTLPDNSKSDVYVKLADFKKVAPNMDEIVKKARGTRGRVPGTRVNGNGS